MKTNFVGSSQTSFIHLFIYLKQISPCFPRGGRRIYQRRTGKETVRFPRRPPGSEGSLIQGVPFEKGRMEEVFEPGKGAREGVEHRLTHLGEGTVWTYMYVSHLRCESRGVQTQRFLCVPYSSSLSLSQELPHQEPAFHQLPCTCRPTRRETVLGTSHSVS